MTKKKKTLKEKQKHGKSGVAKESKILIDESCPESLRKLEIVHWRQQNKLTPYK